MTQSIKVGTTSFVTQVFIQDSASTTGAGKTGLAYNTASLTCYYKKSDGTASVSVTLANITTLGTFVSGGFKEIDATNMPGWYEFHPPNASISSGTKTVFTLQGASGMVTTPYPILLTAVDPQDATRGGMSALPNANAGANGGLPTVDSNNGVKVQNGVGAGQISLSNGNVSLVPAEGRVLTQFTASAGSSSSVTMSPVLGLPDDTIRNGGIKIFSGAGAGQYRRITAYNNTTGVISVAPNWITNPDATSVCAIEYTHIPAVDASGNVSTSGGSSDWTADEKTVIKAVLGIPGSGTTPDDPTTGILDTIRDAVAAVQTTVDDVPTNAELASAVAPLATQASVDTVDSNVDAIKAKTDNLPTDPADASDISTAFSTVNSTLATIAGYIDTEIGTLQTSVNDLPTNSELTTALSGLATTSQLTTVEGKVDTVDTVVDAIKAVTDTIVPLYTAQIEFAKDTANSRDEYTVKWLKNGVPQTSGITTPLIKVTKRDNTDLVAETAMTNVGSGNLIYNEATNRQTAGESYIITVTATIDGSARPFTKVTGRDV